MPVVSLQEAKNCDGDLLGYPKIEPEIPQGVLRAAAAPSSWLAVAVLRPHPTFTAAKAEAGDGLKTLQPELSPALQRIFIHAHN